MMAAETKKRTYYVDLNLKYEHIAMNPLKTLNAASIFHA